MFNKQIGDILAIVTHADRANVKDRASTFLGLVVGLCLAIGGIDGSKIHDTVVILPFWLLLLLKFVEVICGFLFVSFMGKNPDLSAKTSAQAAAINNLPK